jgi:hypothetical protein
VEDFRESGRLQGEWKTSGREEDFREEEDFKEQGFRVEGEDAGPEGGRRWHQQTGSAAARLSGGG